MTNTKFDNTLIIIPTFNESENISQLLLSIDASLPGCHILIIDDNSPDMTAKIIEDLQKNDKHTERLHLIKRAGKLGLGTAYLAGFKWALSRDYEFIFEMDADFSHNPTYLPKLLNTAKDGADLVIGSRYAKAGGIENWPLHRRLISQLGSIYARTWLQIPVKDVTGGFKCFRRRTLQALPLESVKANGYLFQIEITYLALLKKLNVVEVPIIFRERIAGKSKMSSKIALEAIFNIPKLSRYYKKLRQKINP